MRKQKFWCHYLGTDGNTPKRRSIELTYLDIIPEFDNSKSPTPLWYVKHGPDEYNRTLYDIYIQISNSVAVYNGLFSDYYIEKMCESDEQISERHEQWFKKYLVSHPDLSEELKAQEKKYMLQRKTEDMISKRNYMDNLKAISDYTYHLLNNAKWVKINEIRAYEEALSPITQQLIDRRNFLIEKRKQEDEEKRKREEAKVLEQKRKEEEARVEEEKRLDKEEGEFRNGKEITAYDLINLCKRHGININPRTHHTVKTHILTITGMGTCQYRYQRGKKKPVLDGCYALAERLFKYLNEKVL